MGFRIDIDRRWPDGVIPYVFAEKAGDIPQKRSARNIIPADAKADLEFGLVEKTVREVVRECMARWEFFVNEPKHKYIQFKPRQGEKQYLLIVGESSATSGTIGLSDMVEDSGLLTIGYKEAINAIPHEIGHVLGLYHENERNLTVTDGKTVPKYDELVGPLLCPVKDSIAALKIDTIAKDVKNKKRVTVGKYDLLSIMHYPEMLDKNPRLSQWQFNCSMKVVATYLSQISNTDWSEKDVTDYFNAQLLRKKVMNYPSADEVVSDRWLASPGDIAAVRELYAQ